MKNREIAQIFNGIADILEIRDENPFRIRAYRKAARSLEGMAEDIEDLARDERLEEIPGIGKDLASKIEEFIKTGKVGTYEDLKKKIPKTTLSLMTVPGIGPKTASLLAAKLNIKGIDDLEKLLRAHKIKGLPGIKEKTMENMLRGIELLKKGKARTSLGVALPVAYEIVTSLKKLPEVKMCEAAGSLRRMKETVRDIDILITSNKPNEVMDFFVRLPQVKDILAHGPTKSSVITRDGIQVDVRVVEPSSFGAAMAYFTGSKDHNIKLREMAAKKGLKLNEYGLFQEKSNKKIAGRDEEGLYKALNLPFIPPQMREDTGEIEVGLKGKLPKLIEPEDIKGDLHVHSKYSDGSASIEDIASAAIKKGYEYVAITDHSKSLRIAGGLSEGELSRQISRIRRLNKAFKKRFRILTGTEVDILSDGRLDFKDSILKDLDFVVAAIHTGFKQSREVLTGRILKAMENRYIDVIAHPSGRLIGLRDAYQLDFRRVLMAAKETGTILEINAHPLRLDLSDSASRQARDTGIMLAIGTDTHALAELDMMKYGVSVAQRGWLAKKDVLNTYSLASLLKHLKN